MTRAIPAMRQKTSVGPIQQRGMVRPSSGYYGYASRRTDSDSESGRFSSTNVSFFPTSFDWINRVILIR